MLQDDKPIAIQAMTEAILATHRAIGREQLDPTEACKLFAQSALSSLLTAGFIVEKSRR